MSTRALTPIDAQTFWLSAKIPNDTFLLFGFAGVPTDLDQTLDDAAARARSCADLTVRIADDSAFAYPGWSHRGVDRSQFVVHDTADRSWAGCLAGVCALVADQLNARETAWRMHVFPGVEGMPGVTATGTVAVLQISHALGGGGRTSSHAAWMFGRVGGDVPQIRPPRASSFAFPVSAVRAARAHRRLVTDTVAGLVPPPADVRPLLRTNARPSGARALRTVVRKRSELADSTVTVAVLSAVSAALAEHLRDLNDDPSSLAAEVPMAKPPPRLAYNHFGNVGVGLHPDLPAGERLTRIAADLAARRLRAGHPSMRAADLAFAATPAPLLRWGMDRFDPEVRASAVTGNTVVSSVNCGAADFAFGGAPVALAAAFAGLSPMMGLTHVAVGVGDTVTIGVHAAASALGGPAGLDVYAARLEEALG